MNTLELEKLLEDIITKKTVINVSKLGLSPDDICSLLSILGYEQGDADTNGWQHDFWITYHNPENGITLEHSGTWYYGISELKLV